MIIFKIQRSDGRIEQVNRSDKFPAFSQALFEQAKKAFAEKTKDILLSVSETRIFTVKTNSEWIKHNNIYNEDAEGYNPHNKYFTECKTVIYC